MARPRGIKATPEQRAGGYGKVGFCSICVWPGAVFLNKRRIAEGEEFNEPAARALAAQMDPDWHFPNRRVWYTHIKEHLHSPLVTAVENARKQTRELPKTTREGLEMIRDLGLEQAIERPDLVTVDHAIKAMDTLEKKAQGQSGLYLMLAAIQSGRDPDLIGEYRELPALPLIDEVEESETS